MTTDLSPLEFKSATLYAIRVVLHCADTHDLVTALKKRMADAGTFFENEPVVIDATRIDSPIDWRALTQAFTLAKLPVIGVVAQGENLVLATACGLIPVDLSAAPARNASETQTVAAVVEPVTASLPTPATIDIALTPLTAPLAVEAPSAPATTPTMVVKGPLRSGQRVYARQSDLIVMGVVSRGAEVIADGNIHIYGPLRGKAMAGARGDVAARIFTTGFDAELVAIAGVYRVIDTQVSPDVRQQPTVIQLEKDALLIKALGL